MKNLKVYFLATTCLATICTSCQLSSGGQNTASGEDTTVDLQRVIANPLALNYRFQFDDPSRREAADPVLEYFKGKYYLFASKSGGYWSSPDLVKWTYIKCATISTIENYAPTILVHNDSLYFLASGGEPLIFRTANPDLDQWEAIDTHFTYGMTDPAFYKDEDGKIYMYWGCSDKDPIVGVEVDPKDGFRALSTPDTLILHNTEKYGWEVPGVNNEENRVGWNEGPCMIKHKGKYYLHYAAPGTQYRIYGDGIYVSDRPLGPFTYQESNPFCFKPGGFIGGAGHGHTFQDKYGNYWHVASMTISVRHWFERRLGIFPVYIADDQNMYAHTAFTDYPFVVPDKKVDFTTNDCSLGWNLLSYQKEAIASSSHSGYTPDLANDEKVETWWSAETGKSGEWLQFDLGANKEVHAIQVNFSDQDFTVKAPDSYVNYQYKIECSENGKDWTPAVDRAGNTADLPHELIVLPSPRNSRYFRITNLKDMDGKFSISDLRLFGQGKGKRPEAVNEVKVERDVKDKRIIRLSWNPQPGATGYVIRWGVSKDRLNNASMVFDSTYEARYFNRDSEYYFSIDAFNENGVTQSNQISNTQHDE